MAREPHSLEFLGGGGLRWFSPPPRGKVGRICHPTWRSLEKKLQTLFRKTGSFHKCWSGFLLKPHPRTGPPGHQNIPRMPKRVFPPLPLQDFPQRGRTFSSQEWPPGFGHKRVSLMPSRCLSARLMGRTVVPGSFRPSKALTSRGPRVAKS